MEYRLGCSKDLAFSGTRWPTFIKITVGLCRSVVVDVVLRVLCCKNCLVYLDDFIVYRKTFDETLHRLTTMWDSFRAA